SVQRGDSCGDAPNGGRPRAGPPPEITAQCAARPGSVVPEMPGEGPAAAVRDGRGIGRGPGSVSHGGGDPGAAGAGMGAGGEVVATPAGAGDPGRGSRGRIYGPHGVGCGGSGNGSSPRYRA